MPKRLSLSACTSCRSARLQTRRRPEHLLPSRTLSEPCVESPADPNPFARTSGTALILVSLGSTFLATPSDA